LQRNIRSTSLLKQQIAWADIIVEVVGFFGLLWLINTMTKATKKQRERETETGREERERGRESEKEKKNQINAGYYHLVVFRLRRRFFC